MTKDILERTPGYSNEMMYKQCGILASVVNQTIDIKVGRGKNATIIKRLKHNTPTETIDRINRSVDYYKNLMEKTQIEYRDYQKEIIHQGT